jgi:polynucleotide 5'-kinase involved in rRNA processing
MAFVFSANQTAPTGFSNHHACSVITALLHWPVAWIWYYSASYCLLLLSSCCSYVAEDTPNVSYINCHQIIHNLREEAKASGGQGPRVVVAGPTDSGKSSMCRMLLNWAVRAQHQPTYVDLDIGKA